VGAYTDPTGLLYLINRYYDPATGQFVSVDPMVNETEQAYAYAGDNPVNDVDPSGLSSYDPSWLNKAWNDTGGKELDPRLDVQTIRGAHEVPSCRTSETPRRAGGDVEGC
jgi:RHS repeat-associated protein